MVRVLRQVERSLGGKTVSVARIYAQAGAIDKKTGGSVAVHQPRF